MVFGVILKSIVQLRQDTTGGWKRVRFFLIRQPIQNRHNPNDTNLSVAGSLHALWSWCSLFSFLPLWKKINAASKIAEREAVGPTPGLTTNSKSLGWISTIISVANKVESERSENTVETTLVRTCWLYLSPHLSWDNCVMCGDVKPLPLLRSFFLLFLY